MEGILVAEWLRAWVVESNRSDLYPGDATYILSYL